jgi:hypothetical protein
VSAHLTRWLVALFVASLVMTVALAHAALG